MIFGTSFLVWLLGYVIVFAYLYKKHSDSISVEGIFIPITSWTGVLAFLLVEGTKRVVTLLDKKKEEV